jgi:ribose-phosphate pyrophosphokinase
MRRRIRSLLHRRRLQLASGSSHRKLAERIATELGTRLGDVELRTFANDETYCRFREPVRGADVFLVQSCAPPVNDHLVELLLMIQAARLASARRIVAVTPWFPYSRQDRASAPGEPISARLVADLVETAGAEHVVTMDLHARQIPGFFGVPVEHLTALPLLCDHFREYASTPLVAAAPDLGRVRIARRLSRALGADLAVVTKTRPRPDVAEAHEVLGDVCGKRALIADDVVVTGGTLVAAAHALLAAGAIEVRALATHAVLADGALERLVASELAELVVTDTVAIPGARPPKLTVLPVAPLFAEAVRNVFTERDGDPRTREAARVFPWRSSARR